MPLADTENCAPPVIAFDLTPSIQDRLPGHFQSVKGERHRKKRPVVDIDQMTAHQIPASDNPRVITFRAPLGSACTTRFASLKAPATVLAVYSTALPPGRT